MKQWLLNCFRSNRPSEPANIQPLDVSSLNNGIYSGDAALVHATLRHGIRPDAYHIDMAITRSMDPGEGHMNIAHEILAAAHHHGIAPGPHTLSLTLQNDFNPELRQQLIGLYTHTRTQPPTNTLDFALVLPDSPAHREAISQTIGLYSATGTRPEASILQRALHQATPPHVQQQVLALFSASKTRPEPHALDSALCLSDSPEHRQIIVQTIDLYRTTQTPPDPYTLDRTLTRTDTPENHAVTREVIHLFHEQNIAPPQGVVERVLRNAAKPEALKEDVIGLVLNKGAPSDAALQEMISTGTGKIPLLARAYKAHRDLPADHPLRTPLERIIRSRSTNDLSIREHKTLSADYADLPASATEFLAQHKEAVLRDSNPIQRSIDTAVVRGAGLPLPENLTQFLGPDEINRVAHTTKAAAEARDPAVAASHVSRIPADAARGHLTQFLDSDSQHNLAAAGNRQWQIQRRAAARRAARAGGLAGPPASRADRDRSG